MRPRIVADSACNTNAELDRKLEIYKAPFQIELNGKQYLDDGTIDISDFLHEIEISPTIAKTAGTSPQAFMEAVGDAKEAFIITITSKLSGAYSNALLAAERLKEMGNRKVHVFDSASASGGETGLAQKIFDWIEENKTFEEIVKLGDEWIKNHHLFFVLENISTLVKAGRIPSLAGKVVSGLHIIPICSADKGAIKINEVKEESKTL